jgi:hypothetical protein
LQGFISPRKLHTMTNGSFLKTIKHNCDVSDARDNGIYSICTLVLKLRNLYKWENGLEPWQEPDSPVLLDWIAAKEEYWETLQEKSFSQIPVNGENVDPFLLPIINEYLSSDNHVYGAGYGRSMKAVFFIAEVLEDKMVEGCQALILGEEKARELSSPFAMLQDGVIYIRKEPLRFFFWDQIQDINPSCKVAMHQALACYGLLKDGCSFDREKLIDVFDTLIDQELDIFIYHEVGESQESLLGSDVLKKIIAAFPASALELVARAVKDILADTHPNGLLGQILAREKKSSLGFYVSFLDGMRKHLCAEINEASKQFWESGDWALIEKARLESRIKNEGIAVELQNMCSRLDRGESPDEIRVWAEKNVLAPLGLHVPAREEEAI